jgi:Tfp pilus assembly major pilin PilA
MAFYVAVQHTGPPDNAAKYKCKVEFVNKDDTQGITVMHLTRSADDDLGNICDSKTLL